MAEIRLIALERRGGPGGPDLPAEFGVILRDREWPGGGTIKVLTLTVGADTLEIWPADAARIEQLGQKLYTIAQRLYGEEGIVKRVKEGATG